MRKAGNSPSVVPSSPVPLAARAEITTVPLRPRTPLTPLALSPLAPQPAPAAPITAGLAAPVAPPGLFDTAPVEDPPDTLAAPPLMPPPQVMPPPQAMPPPRVMPAPQVMPPPVRRQAPPRSRSAGRFVVPIVFLIIVGSIVAPIANGVKHAFDATKSSGSSVPTFAVPTFAVPTFAPPTFDVHVPSLVSDNNLDIALIFLGTSENVYQALNGHFTYSPRALANGGFRPDPIAAYALGIDGNHGYCAVGNGGKGTFWRLYKSTTSYLAAGRFRTEADAKQACPLPVRWGPNGSIR